MNYQSEQDLDAYMAIACAVAIEEAKTMPTTPEIRQQAHAITEASHDRLAQIRREERAKRPSNVVSGAIRDAIKAMSPAQIMARLTELRGAHVDLRFAHRHFDHLSDDDLRSALEDIESLIEQQD